MFSKATLKERRLYYREEWSEKDRLERYIKWMSSAADNGSLAACKELCQIYKEGIYVPKDSAKVFRYTKAAAQLKDPDAMFDLGERYAKGVGCKKDRAAAVKWMKQAAHAGNDVLIHMLTPKQFPAY